MYDIRGDTLSTTIANEIVGITAIPSRADPTWTNGIAMPQNVKTVRNKMTVLYMLYLKGCQVLPGLPWTQPSGILPMKPHETAAVLPLVQLWSFQPSFAHLSSDFSDPRHCTSFSQTGPAGSGP